MIYCPPKLVDRLTQLVWQKVKTMPKFLYLCVGGEMVPEYDGDTLMNDWMAYMGRLAATGKLGEGAPLGPNSRSVTTEGVLPYDMNTPASINGYWVMETADLDEAVAMVNGCPHLACKGRVEVLEIVPMAMPS